ncbi:hypothetical protein PHLCEN_2v8049 [Hermanssonia centrifuga]|uniref:Uncharacterized protein n=1 Tax=Hermanssonia centrifuga TaxID=98765 RepID=A0A2R6NVE5_9APHY|nr:hypothetical protein PHLCEN_2v8049 [Hermanssonia centrifuga]
MEDPRFPILISAPSSSQAGSSALQEKKHIPTFGHIEGIPVGAVFESLCANMNVGEECLLLMNGVVSS